MAKLKIDIEVDDKGTVKFKRFNRVVGQTDSRTQKYARSLGGATTKMKGLAASTALTIGKTAALGAAIVTAAGAYAAWKLKDLAASFINVGSSMDELKISLDTITKGEGEKWFQELNRWALKMPINTKKAIEAFTNMRAMGLKPSIEDMTTLVDTTSALGGKTETLMGISRALGQIKTKGRVSTEELLQLAERGVPAFEILQEKMGLTSEQISNIGNAGLDAQQTINALIEGMAERFGGQSEKIQSKWSGMTTALKSYWVEFQRLVMESGVMQWIEENLKALVDWVDELYSSGKLQAWAQDLANWLVNLGDKIKNFIKEAVGGWEDLAFTIETTMTNIRNWIDWVMPSIKMFLRIVKKIWDIGMKVSGISGLGGLVNLAYMLENKGQPTTEPSPASDVSRQSGTGPAGLPYTGWFYGHKGEIVKSPAESESERRGNPGGGNTYILQPTFMTGDRESIARAFNELKQLEKRWGMA